MALALFIYLVVKLHEAKAECCLRSYGIPCVSFPLEVEFEFTT